MYLTSVLYLSNQSKEKITELITSCKNFGTLCDVNYLYDGIFSLAEDLGNSLNYSVLMMSLPYQHGINEIMTTMKDFLNQDEIEANSWIPEKINANENIFNVIYSAQWMLGGCLVLHDVPVDLFQAENIIRMAVSVEYSENILYLQKTHLPDNQYHIGIMRRSLLSFALNKIITELNSKNESNSISNVLKALELVAQNEPKIKIKYF